MVTKFRHREIVAIHPNVLFLFIKRTPIATNIMSKADITAGEVKTVAMSREVVSEIIAANINAMGYWMYSLLYIVFGELAKSNG